MADDDFLAKVRQKYERATEADDGNHTSYKDDTEFAYDIEGAQWPPDARNERKIDCRPCLTRNHMPTFIRQVVNDARMNKPAITVHPADSNADKETAEILSGLIRNIEVQSDADIAYDTAINCAVSGGFGYIRVNTKATSDDTFDKDIVIERVADPLTVWRDPDSDSADGSDWNCAFVATMLTKDEFEAQYGGEEPVDWTDYHALPAPWCDGDNVMLAEYWEREKVKKLCIALSNDTVVELKEYQANKQVYDMLGVQMIGEPQTIESFKVTQYICSGAKVLETVEWPGKYIPIVPVYGDEINIAGKRYFKSLIADAKDAQRDHNLWETNITEMGQLSPKTPYIGEEGAFDSDTEKWSTINNAAHANVTHKKGTAMPVRQPYPGPPAQMIERSLRAIDDMKAIIGLHNASLGERSNETSGVAINARQREGDVSTFHFIDNLTRSIRQTGRILLDLIPKVYSTARVLRVLGVDNEPKTVQVAPGAAQPPQGQQQAQPGQQEAEEIQRIYDITAGKYDLTVKAGPSFTTMREEAAVQLGKIISNFPQSAPILGPMWLRQNDWAGADEAADELAKMGKPAEGPQGVPQEQVQQLMQQFQQMQQQLQQITTENAALKQDSANKSAELQIKARDAETKQYDAETKRMSVQFDVMRASAEAANPYSANGQAPSQYAA